MKMLSLVCLTLAAACGFGDNGAVPRPGPDGNPAPDAGPTPTQDGSPDAPVTPPDAPPANACTLVPQAGCPSGAACDLDATGSATECRDVTAQGTSNSLCATETACRAGYTCLSNAGGGSSCAKFCETDSDCNGDGSRCVIGIADGNGNDTGHDVCSNHCDPAAQSGCPTGMACFAQHRGAGDITDCRFQGTTPIGALCSTQSQCEPGSSCITYQGQGRCLAYCVVGDPSACDVDETCLSLTNPITIGAVEYGHCAPEL